VLGEERGKGRIKGRKMEGGEGKLVAIEGRRDEGGKGLAGQRGEK